VGAIFFVYSVLEDNMFGFKEVAAMASAIGLIALQPSATLASVDPRELSASEVAFTSSFKGVDGDGETLVWSSDAPVSAPQVVIRLVPMGSALSSAESVWAVRATLTLRDSTGAPMESKLYGIIDWPKHELRLHGNCDSGTKSGSSVTAIGTFTDFDIAGSLNVLSLTASR
jgi:hypothetical protein